jgi:nucleoside-diphosphate-sugar epimerase
LLSLLVVLLILGGLGYVGWRLIHAARAARQKTRVIGPDDDPDFLWGLGRGDDTTKR